MIPLEKLKDNLIKSIIKTGGMNEKLEKEFSILEKAIIKKYKKLGGKENGERN
jgi:hypothetical protein